MGKSMKKLAKIEDKLGKYVLSADHLSKPLCKCEKCKNIPGENRLGKTLMRVREELRNQNTT